MTPRLFHFQAGDQGLWKIREVRNCVGAGLPRAPRLNVGEALPGTPGTWSLRGIRSQERYSTTQEHDQLATRQEGLGRADSTCAALIPIRKSEAWWQLSQDRRRAIFEEQSHHTSIGLRYLPAIARRLYHCRDLGPEEPFDFLTWFEFRPDHEEAFDLLLKELRVSPEWSYVVREVDIRLERLLPVDNPKIPNP
jgi:hypothetical protein